MDKITEEYSVTKDGSFNHVYIFEQKIGFKDLLKILKSNCLKVLSRN